jgi:hypothetical protein
MVAAIAGGVGLALTVGGGLLFGGAEAFFRAYLLGFTFWSGLGLGGLGIGFIQFLTGGRWGLATRRIYEAAATSLPFMALLFVPLLFGIPVLYAWARPEVVAADPVLQHRAVFQNTPFFVVRSIGYLLAWAGLAFLLLRRSAAEDQPAASDAPRRLQRLSVIGVLVLALTVTFAAIDWLMSLDAEWSSTMYPVMVGMSDLLLALAFAVVVVAVFGTALGLAPLLTPSLYNDLGNLLLAFLMLWAYLAFFQYLLIWAGNLTDEIPWYVLRSSGGWRPVALALAVVGFGVPFWLLLFRPLKRNARPLAAIAGLILVTRVIDVYWLVAPPFLPQGPAVNWLDIAAWLGFGGVWLAAFVWQLARRPIVAPNDPRLAPTLEAVRAVG